MTTLKLAELKPLSHSHLNPLPITDSLFVIGRDIAPFSTYEAAVVNGLAMRHARIFLESNELYLIDLESPEGTTHNGQPVTHQPVTLRDGDTLCFGGNLSYQISIDDSLAETALQVSLLFVTLLPAGTNSGSEKIVLSRFPLLISRDSGLFAHYQNTLPSALKFLSRRHAYLFIKDKKLYVEDLGSTNGTWVGDNKLEPHVEVRLRDGEKIAFGSDQAAYTVQIATGDNAESIALEITKALAIPATDETSGIVWVDKTLYPTLADSFLDIFCEQQNDAEPSASESPDSKADAIRVRPLNKIGAFSRELKDALGEPSSGRRRGRLAWFAGGVCLALAVAVGVYLYGGAKREISTLLAQQQYSESLRQADRYLAANPDDAQVRALASEALIKSVLPEWLKQVNEARFTDAAKLLAETEQYSQTNPEGKNILSLLQWIGDLKEFLNERGGIDAPLILFQHETVIDSLIQRYDASASEQDLLMAKIVDHAPSFTALRARVGSELRALRNDQSVYLKAIATLQQDLEGQLISGAWSDALETLTQFEQRYPKVSGVGKLREDIDLLVELAQAVNNENLSAVLRLYDSVFATPLVTTLADDWISANLPPPAGLEQYRQALAAWKEGDSERVSAILQPLSEQVWGEMATKKNKHFKQVTRTFKQLSATREQANYDQRLLQFRNSLDADEDSFFLAAIEDDVRQQQQVVLGKAEQLLQKAKASWIAYQKNGGISGLLRLEKKMSESFEDRSELLTTAYAEVASGMQIYELLRQQASAAERQLYEDILVEIKRQRQWLGDLAMVLEPSVLNQKLGLLPVLEEAK